MKRKMIIGIIVVLLLVAGCTTYTCLPKFGSTPKGERLTKRYKSA